MAPFHLRELLYTQHAHPCAQMCMLRRARILQTLVPTPTPTTPTPGQFYLRAWAQP